MADQLQDDDILLYYEGNSYHCHRVLLALGEKRLSFKKIEVDIFNLQNLSPNYMKLNPSGETPTLVHGVEVVAGPEQILHYLDEAFPEHSRLFPEESTKESVKCQYFLKLAAKIDLDTLTLGVPMKTELAQVDGDELDNGYREQDVQKVLMLCRESIPEKCDQLAEENSELKDNYQKLKERSLSFPDCIDDDELDAALKMTNDVMAKLEDELKTRRIEEPPEKEWWLIGKTFSAVDVYWASILHRLEQLGLAKRYWANGKRPHVTAYLSRIKQRETFTKVPRTRFEKFVDGIKRRWPWMVPAAGFAAAGALALIIM
ncbi:ganglioside-induced differentiation-associated protein 1-like isoform X2 [Ptychodera flava]|uniref:ganglioside-induced differentiation-associated protein 1-like isoform X2 n=1 Tax=Ptychodera flava TaxID=63121 RepID=UPI003969F322